MKFTLLITILLFLVSCNRPANNLMPVPSLEPSEGQQKQIERKYGMFIHFGINTFHDMEWTDGSKDPGTYKPDQIDADQWIKTAAEAGMKYVILISKHHDGFCLWDSKLTEYDIASSGNKTNVIEAVAKACRDNNIGLGIYYSLWDRNRNGEVADSTLDMVYNDYMIAQVNELLDITENYTEVIEFWFDGGWVKENYRWPIEDLYRTIKSREPLCQVGVNWSIGLPDNPDHHPVKPREQEEGYPIRYFPSDFRLGDPYLPGPDDPKIFSHNGENYYMPWESTVCISQRWFYNTTDTTFKSIDYLENMYTISTVQDNILILNCPPNRQGRIREEDINILNELKQRLNL